VKSGVLSILQGGEKYLLNSDLQKYHPEHRETRFADKGAFAAWLKKTSTYKITFKDEGQDCREWYIDNGGEVLHANLQARVWNGMIVDLSRLQRGKEIGVMDSDKMQTRFYDFLVESIEKL
jgi:hypothetical protein